MVPQKLALVYFSPTNTTRTVLEEIARGVGKEISVIIDMTKPGERSKQSHDLSDCLVLIGAPVYAGRIPRDAVDSFKLIRASGNPAILTVLYGNREFEDALLELKNLSIDCGLSPLAASAFIGEHSFSSENCPIAINRPDTADLEKAFLFGKQIADMLTRDDAPDKNNLDKKLEKNALVHVPGNFPYRDGMGPGAFSFIEVTDDCDDCGICVTACPKDAVDAADTYSTIDEKCIFCCACIKACPQEARIFKEGPIREKAKWLNENFGEPKEPEFFLGPKL